MCLATHHPNTTMIPSSLQKSALVAAVVLLAGGTASSNLFAQAATAAGSSSVTARATTEDELILLDPFAVTASSEDTYDATNTNSVTGTNLSLNRTPLDAKIFNSTMMEEMAVVDIGQMLSDIGGLGAPLLGAGEEQGRQEGDALNYKTMSARGLTINNPRRDGFLRDDTALMDSFSAENVEVLMGSNSLLFGSGDAGGVVNVNSKKARLNRTFAKAGARWDSEGSMRYTGDLNYGSDRFGVRLNAVKGDEKYFRPVLGMKTEGMQLTATVRPLKWLTVSGEWLKLDRNLIRGATLNVRAPTNLILTNGERLDNQSTRYITGYGGTELTDGYINMVNQDTFAGAHMQHAYEVAYKAISAEARATKDLHFQFRYGQTDRINRQVASSRVLYHPDAPGNQWRDDAGNLRREWALNTTVNAREDELGARGYKFTGTYHKDLGRWGDHRLTAFTSEQQSWNIVRIQRFFEVDANGNVVQNLSQITNANSGRNALPAAWVAPSPEKIFGQFDFPTTTLVHPQNGKTYRLMDQVYPGAVPPTPTNPLGLSGPIDAVTGYTSNGSLHGRTNERAVAASLFSNFWRGRIDTMVGYRAERARTERLERGTSFGPMDYDSLTVGFVVDTPLDGVRFYSSYATNARAAFDRDLDIYNRSLPIGEGESREAGFKFSAWNHRLSGNVAYYQSTGKNYAATLGGIDRNDVDPDGINGRNGGDGYTYDMESRGVDLFLSLRPIKPWEITLNYTRADGQERSDVVLPVFYNDQFNTLTHNGALTVGVKNAATGAVAPLMVRSNPANPNSALIPLTVAMLKDPSSSYFAQLDPDSGQILNAAALGLDAAGVGTNVTGLAISEHQLGFVPPSPQRIVRKSGEKNGGFGEDSFSMINRYRFQEGALKNLVIGWAVIYQNGVRGYMYTDAADAGARKMYYFPDRFENRAFLSYTWRINRRIRAIFQANVSNLFDKQEIALMPRQANGDPRFFVQTYTPRKTSLTLTLAF